MKFSLKGKRKWAVLGVAVLATVTPSFAIFGLGDIVFDPSSWAELAQETFTAATQLQTIQNNLTHFSFKQFWGSALSAIKQANVQNQLGETTGMTAALNTDSPAAASTAWSSATVAVNGNATTYLAGQTPGSSLDLSQLSMIEMSDSISPDCLNAVGQYRAARTANNAAVAGLQQQQLDTGDDTNSEVEQLNLLNASEAQKTAEMQTQGTLQTCLAAQTTISNMQQRNAAAEDLNTWTDVQQQQLAKSFRLLPTKDEAKDKVWTATDWAKKRKGWIFITSRTSEREALRPLHSLWIDLLVMRLRDKPKPNQKKVWFIIEELPDLQRLPQLHSAVTQGRKGENPIVLCFQGKAQVESIYGKLAEVLLSQSATKVFLKTSEPKAAQWISQTIGSVEIERLRETKFDGSRSGRNFVQDRQTEPLVMDSEIEGLTDRHAYIKFGNHVSHFAFDYLDLPVIAPAFISRVAEDHELGFDRKTLEPKKQPDPAPPQKVKVAEAQQVKPSPTAAVPTEAPAEVGGGF